MQSCRSYFPRQSLADHDHGPMLAQSSITFYDVGPTLNLHMVTLGPSMQWVAVSFRRVLNYFEKLTANNLLNCPRFYQPQQLLTARCNVIYCTYI